MLEIPRINLTRREYEKLIRSSHFNDGAESVICKTPQKDTLYKLFDYETEWDPELAYQNKKEKIIRLYNNPISYSVLPISLIDVDGIFAGYEMTYDRKDVAVSQLDLTFEQKISYLEKVRKILTYYERLGIVYGDIKSHNTLINRRTGQVKFCDIDNINIGDNPIDVMTEELFDFTDERDSIDSMADIYMYNLLTLEQIAYPGETYGDILAKLRDGLYPLSFSKETHRTLDSMLSPREFTGETIVQYAKKM